MRDAMSKNGVPKKTLDMAQACLICITCPIYKKQFGYPDLVLG